jgi:hypothetical protein
MKSGWSSGCSILAADTFRLSRAGDCRAASTAAGERGWA